MAHPPQAVPAAALTRFLPPVLVVVAVLAGMATVIAGEFVWDDHVFLEDEAGWRGLGPKAVGWMLSDTYGHYQPLTWLSFAIDHALWGMDAHAFRATNLVIHAANALCVYALALAVYRLRGKPGAGYEPAMRWAAAAAALAFALHPLRVEAVAWSVERRNLLGTCGFLAAILAYLRAVGGGGRRWWALALACHAASLLARAGGVVLPLVLAIVDVYPLARHRSVRWTRLLAEKLPFAALALPIALVAVAAQRESGALVDWEHHTARERVGQAMYGLAFYPAKTVVPNGLSPLHSLPRDLDPFTGRHLAGGAAALAITAVAIALARRYPGGLAAWVTYLVLIGPLLGGAQVGLHEVACRYSYAAAIPFAVAAGALVLAQVRRNRRGGISAGALALVVIALLAVATQRMIGVWHDESTVWARVLEVEPANAFAHMKLARAHAQAGELDLAIEHGQQALRLEPAFPGAAINLGLALAERGQYDEARSAFERGLADASRDVERAEARLGLGVLALAQGALELAIEHLDHALSLGESDRARGLPRRDRASARYHRGEAFRRLAGRVGAPKTELYEKAVADFSAALAIDPDHGRAHLSLGLALFLRGDPADLPRATEHLERATELRPEMPEAWYGLAKALAGAGRTDEARARLARARRVSPPAWKGALDAFERDLGAR